MGTRSESIPFGNGVNYFMNDFYNDSDFFYDQYWQNRQYEHQSEVMAISRLVKNKKFANASDIGGGFGRLCRYLTEISERVTLVEPSDKMRSMAKSYLKSYENVKIVNGSSDQTSLPNASQNLLISVRVLHHLPDISSTIAEFSRVVKPNGFVIVEFANSLNIKARIRSLLTGKKITMLPIDLRSPENIKRGSIPFVNHHPKSVLQQLEKNGFAIISRLSVSNFRISFLKKIMPTSLLLALEYLLQIPLGWLYFGPSVFILAQRIDI